MGRVWTRQPPPHTPIDFAHPLSEGLRVCFPMNDRTGAILRDVGPNGFHATTSSGNAYISDIRMWGGSPQRLINTDAATSTTDHRFANGIDLLNSDNRPWTVAFRCECFNTAQGIDLGVILNIRDGQTSQGGGDTIGFLTELDDVSGRGDISWGWEGLTTNEAYDLGDCDLAAGDAFSVIIAYDGSGFSSNAGAFRAWCQKLGEPLTERTVLTTAGGYPFSATANMLFDFDGFPAVDRYVNMVTVWDGRAFTEADAHQWHTNPWQMFKPKHQFALADVPEDVRPIKVPNSKPVKVELVEPHSQVFTGGGGDPSSTGSDTIDVPAGTELALIQWAFYDSNNGNDMASVKIDNREAEIILNEPDDPAGGDIGYGLAWMFIRPGRYLFEYAYTLGGTIAEGGGFVVAYFKGVDKKNPIGYPINPGTSGGSGAGGGPIDIQGALNHRDLIAAHTQTFNSGPPPVWPDEYYVYITEWEVNQEQYAAAVLRPKGSSTPIENLDPHFSHIQGVVLRARRDDRFVFVPEKLPDLAKIDREWKEQPR